MNPAAGTPASALTQLRDVAVVALLLILALLGLDDSFATREYLVVGGLAGAAALVTAAMVAGNGKGTEVFLLVAPVVYIVVGTMAAMRGDQPIGLPSPDAMAGLLAGTITAPGDFLTTIPPVDATGGVMVLPFAIGFLSAGAAGWMALRTRRAVAPVAPMLIALVLSIMLGTAEPGRLEFRSIVFAGVALWWISVRATRSDDIENGNRGQLLRALTTSLLVGAIAVGLTALGLTTSGDGKGADLEPDRAVLRGRVGSGTDVSGADNPLSDFRRYNPRPAVLGKDVFNDTLLRIKGLRPGTRLRFVTLDEYDGSTWSAGNRTVPGADDALFQRIGTEIDPQRRGKSVTVNVEVLKPYGSNWLPLAGELTSLSFDYSDGRAQREDVRYNLATDAAYVSGGVGAGDDYTFTAVLPKDDLRPNARGFQTDGQLQPDGRFLDLFLFPWFKSSLTPMERVRSVARYLHKNGRYSDGVLPTERQYSAGHDEQRLGFDFVASDQIVGNDEQYAAAMALLANRLAVPARVVVGALVPKGGRVKGKDVKAWVEVRVADGSWRTLETSTFMSRRPPKRTDAEVERPAEHLAEEGESADLGKPGDQANGQQRRDSGAPGTGTNGRDLRSRLPLLLPLLGLVPWLIPFTKWLRRRRRRMSGRGHWSAPWVGGWREVVDTARDLGATLPVASTRMEQAEALGHGRSLALAADAVIYAREPDEASSAEVFWRDVDAQRKAMRSRAGLVRRVWARFNPASLRRS
ncbi:DUF3488 and transglutaminase-like domain-containing protein [Nocardioides sp. Root151]|uniref:DUF3488 and transglutaminase-like domain-containing protein n=1 Tax=Nocardioides sp. Root151 TaxID=1736475 RepID=UPI000AE26C20|nr:DUF3488 and transglutaminase-like domain-containing protein [Nocardioides sp. Root151]